MYGKHFESLYEGSMIGAGAMVFAVWGYVIAKQKPDSKVGMQVRLNPRLLGPILGESVAGVEKAIEYLCKPDPHSTTKSEGGKRLVRVGEFDYRVVNGAKYHAIRNEEERKEQNRAAQERFREKNKKVKGPLVGEQTYEKALVDGASEAELDKLTEPQ